MKYPDPPEVRCDDREYESWLRIWGPFIYWVAAMALAAVAANVYRTP
jgi:hypothetical protein